MQNGNISKAGKGCKGPNKSFLFLLTRNLTLEVDYLEMGLAAWKRWLLFDCFGALLMLLENLAAWFICTPGRTHHRIRSPRLAASSQ